MGRTGRSLLCRRNPCYTTQIMPAREPDLPWYQFSLRSLLLLTLFVAVLCSIGVRTHWSVTAAIAVGGITGGIVARSWLGLVLGVMSGGMCAVAMAAVCVIMWRLLFRVPFSMSIPLDGVSDGIRLAAIIGSLLGGVLGGRVARFRSQR